MEHKITNELPPLPSESMASDVAQNPEHHAQDFVAERQSTQALERGVSPQSGGPSQTQMQQTTPVPPAVPIPAAALPAIDPQTPIIADDSDLIEKEWVLKAKEIVARTRQDPYQQNKEVERIKADYMKKRYNKDIRVTED